MTIAGTARWLRDRLWIGWPVGAVAWLVWLGSIAYGTRSSGRPIDAEGTPIGVDHLTFYSAARLIREDRAALMYDYSFLGPYQGTLLGWDWEMLLGYRNPPFYALLYLPTAGLPFVASMIIWNLIGLMVLVAAVHLLKPERPWRTVLWCLTFYPVFAVVFFGQNSLLSLGVFALVWRLMNSRQPFAAGLAAGLLWFKPQLLLGLFIWWALAPRKHLASWLGVAVTGAVLAAISWIILPDASRAFVDSLQANLTYGGEKGWNKESPRAFWSLLLPQADGWIITLLTVASVLPLLMAAVQVSRRTASATDAMFPTAVFLSLWVSPHALIYEWSLLVPAAIVLWQRVPDRRDVWLVLFTVAWIALAISTTLAKGQIDYLQPPFVVQIAVPVMGVVGWRAMRELAIH